MSLAQNPGPGSFYVRRLGRFSAYIDTFVGDKKNAAGVVRGCVQRRIRQQISVPPKLVANRFSGKLGVVEFECPAPGRFGQLVYCLSSFRLIASICAAGPIWKLERINRDIISLEFIKDLVERRLASAVEAVANNDDRCLARSRHQRDQDFAYSRTKSIK